MRMARLQVELLQSPQTCALYQPHASPGARKTARGSSGYLLQWRHSQLCSGRPRRGTKRLKVGQGAGPQDAASARTLEARACCAFAALLLALRFPWRRLEAARAEICAAGRQEGCRLRGPLLGPHMHNETAVSPIRNHPRPALQCQKRQETATRLRP